MTNTQEVDFNHVAVLHGKIVGFASGTVMKKDADVVDEDLERAWLNLRVAKNHRREGIGSKLLMALLDDAKPFEIKHAYLRANTESGHAFCANFGGVVTSEGILSHLKLDTKELDKISYNLEKLDARSPEVFVTLTENIPLSQKDEYHGLIADYFEELSSFSSDWNFDREQFIGELKEDEKHREDDNITQITAFARDKDGNPIGISEVWIDPTKPWELFTFISGVRKDFRSRGICKRMKSMLMLYARSRYPEIELVTTANDKDNQVMLRINSDFGFVNSPKSVQYRLDVNSVNEKMQAH